MAIDFAALQEESDALNTQPGQFGDLLDKYVIFPPGDGAITVRILPPVEGKSLPFQWTRTHRLGQRNIHCPKAKQGERYVGECEICKYYNWLWKQSEDMSKPESERKELQAKARAIKPVERYYYNCIVRSWTNPKTEKVEKNVGPKILSIGKMLHKMIVRAFVGDASIDEPKLGDVSDVTANEGRDFKIVKQMVASGNDKYPQYNLSKFMDKSPAGTQQEIDQWLANLHDLQALRVLKTNDELEHELKRYLGVVVDQKNTFDPTKFQKPSAQSVEEAIRQEIANSRPAATQTAEPVAATVPAGDDEVMAEAEFMASLKKLK
jgi:hypothetical protein